MKKLNIVAVLFSVLVMAAGVFTLAGCWAPVNVEKTENKPVPADMAKVRIPLPGASNSRAVGLSGAQKHANFFEVSLRESVTGAVISKNAALSRGYIDVVIPPGIYDILLFAGENKQDTSSPLLLATSHAQNVDIIAGQINDVYMTLVTFDLDLTALPPVVKLNVPFTAGFTVKPRNPLIAPADGSSAFPHQSSTISVDGVTGNIDETGWGYDGVTYTYTASVSVKSLTVSEKAVIGFTGYIGMFDETPKPTPVWTYADFRHAELGGHYKKEVTVDRNADTNIIIDWERPDYHKAIVTSAEQVYVIKTDGSLWAWGRNNYGQLGDGTTTTRLEPVQIGTDTDWQAVDVKGNYTAAIKTDGSLWAWGQNNYGQLGDGTNTTRYAPVRIGTDKDWKTVSAGSFHTAAVKTDGSLWTWGNGQYRLGNGTTSCNTPVRVGTANDWQAVDVGDRHGMAIKTDGSLWAWGENDYGQLGIGTSSSSLTPIQVGTGKDWKTVIIGAGATLAQKTDGSLWVWGRRVGPTTSVSTPTRIGNDTDWKDMSAARDHHMGVKTDNSLWAWGYYPNSAGVYTGNVPVKISTVDDWEAVFCTTGGSASNYRSYNMALKTDGSLWAWGDNTYGQLGNGTTTSISLNLPEAAVRVKGF